MLYMGGQKKGFFIGIQIAQIPIVDMYDFRKRPKNLQCFTKRSVTIERAGVKLISKKLVPTP